MLRSFKYNSETKVFYLDAYDNNEINGRLLNRLVNFFENQNNINSLKSREDVKVVKTADELANKNKIRQVFKVSNDEKNYFIKRQFKQRRLRYICNTFCQKYFSGGVKSLRMLNKLRKNNISAPAPCFCLVFARGIFNYDTFLVTEEIKDSVSLYDYLLENRNIDFVFKQELIKKLAKFWADLFKGDLLFKDASLDNFLLKRYNNEVEIFLVDVDNVFSNKFFKNRNEIKTLARFNAYVIQDIDSLDNLELNLIDIVRFYKNFFSYYDPSYDFRSFLEQVRQATVKKLIERNNKNLVYQFEFFAQNNL